MLYSKVIYYITNLCVSSILLDRSSPGLIIIVLKLFNVFSVYSSSPKSDKLEDSMSKFSSKSPSRQTSAQEEKDSSGEKNGESSDDGKKENGAESDSGEFVVYI